MSEKTSFEQGKEGFYILTFTNFSQSLFNWHDELWAESMGSESKLKSLDLRIADMHTAFTNFFEVWRAINYTKTVLSYLSQTEKTTLKQNISNFLISVKNYPRYFDNLPEYVTYLVELDKLQNLL